MAVKLSILTVLLFFAPHATGQSTRRGQGLPSFMGREVTVMEPQTEDDGLFPKGPASICIEGPPHRQCYTAPKDFGLNPMVELVQVERGMPALLFSAASGGVSGFQIHFALLRPGERQELQDLFSADITVSNQSDHAFWNDSTISRAAIFVTADYVWGPRESHYSSHRYIVSAYVVKPSDLDDGGSYYLEDRYMTARFYDYLDSKLDVLTSEKPEIIRRLRRLRSPAKPQPRAPHCASGRT